MSAQLTRIHTLAACRKAVLPATLAVLMGAPALAPAAWNWGLAGPKIYWAEVIKSEQAAPADQPVGTTQPDVPDTLYIHGDDLSICKAGSTTPVWTPAVTWSILVSMYNVNSPPAELVATCENENTIKAVCPDMPSSIAGADSTNGICAGVIEVVNNGQYSDGQFNDGQYIIDIAPKQQARDRSGTAYWVRGTSLGNMPVHVDSYWEWLDALQTHVDALQVNVDDLNTAVGMPYDDEDSLATRVTALEANPGGGGCGTTLVTLENGATPAAGMLSNLSSFNTDYFSLVRPSYPDDNEYHNAAGVGCPGTLSNFRITLDGNPGTGNRYDFALVVNGQATTIGCTISGSSATTCTDTTAPTTIALPAGSQVSVLSDPDDGPTNRKARVQVDYTPSGGSPAPIF